MKSTIDFFLFITICVLANTSYGQNQLSVRVLNADSIPVPYASLLIGGKYGFLCDSLGHLSYPSYREEVIEISSPGYKMLSILSNQFYLNDNVYLEKISGDLDSLEAKNIGGINHIYSGVCRKPKKNSFLTNTNFESAILVRTPDVRNNILKTIILYAGFKGENPSPLRINIYSVGKNSLPLHLINSENIIFRPHNKFELFNFDVTNLAIRIPPEGIIVAVEILNTYNSKQKLSKSWHPIIGICDENSFKSIKRADYMSWTYSKNPALYMEFETLK